MGIIKKYFIWENLFKGMLEKLSSPFQKMFELQFLYCRDVACYVSTRPYFFVRSRKMSMLFSDHSKGIYHQFVNRFVP